MFERLVLRFSDSENYLDILLLSAFFTLLSILLVQHVIAFEVGGTNLGGIIAVLLTSLAVSYPFISYTVEQEREELRQRWGERKLLQRHARQMELYLAFFLGVTVAFALSTFFVSESFYFAQLEVLKSIRGPTGNVIGGGLVSAIIHNNLWVFGITFVLSFFLASGFLFVLVWNASVLGVLIGSLANSALHIPFITVLYLPHGLLEVGAYVLAGLAGSLLSYRIESDIFDEVDAEHRSAVTKDVAVMLFFGVLMILLAGVIEVM